MLYYPFSAEFENSFVNSMIDRGILKYGLHSGFLIFMNEIVDSMHRIDTGVDIDLNRLDTMFEVLLSGVE